MTGSIGSGHGGHFRVLTPHGEGPIRDITRIERHYPDRNATTQLCPDALSFLLEVADLPANSSALTCWPGEAGGSNEPIHALPPRM